MNEQYILVRVMITGVIVLLVFLFFIVFYMLLHRRKQEANLREREKLKFEHSLNVMTERLQEQEHAMNQISREIHDNVSQTVDLLHMNLKALQEAPDNQRALTNSAALTQQIGNALRNISYSLNGDYVTAHGLAAVLEKELDYMSSSSRAACRLEVEGYAESIAPEEELLMFRIAQEALHNCIKHARAKNINVKLVYGNVHFEMRITDDGVGFDSAAGPLKPGLGLRNMEQRARLLDAELSITSKPGEGCTLSLVKPIAIRNEQ